MCLWHDVKLRKTQLEVRSPNVTWRRDLWCHRVIVFLEMCQIVDWIGMANLAALRAAVFPLSAKNLRGGRITAPPGRARVKLPFGSVFRGACVYRRWATSSSCPRSERWQYYQRNVFSASVQVYFTLHENIKHQINANRAKTANT